MVFAYGNYMQRWMFKSLDFSMTISISKLSTVLPRFDSYLDTTIIDGHQLHLFIFFLFLFIYLFIFTLNLEFDVRYSQTTVKYKWRDYKEMVKINTWATK